MYFRSSRKRLMLGLILLLSTTICATTGEFLKGATGADRMDADRRLPYYPQYPVYPPSKSKKSKKGGSKGSKGYDPCYGKGKGKGMGTFGPTAMIFGGLTIQVCHYIA
jgi:hypothetical protein